MNGQSVDDYLVKAITHAIHPALEYLNYICYRPTTRGDFKFDDIAKFTQSHQGSDSQENKTRFANVHATVENISFANISPLLKVLSPLFSGSIPEAKVYRAKVSIEVPIDSTHDIWSRLGLQKKDGKYHESTRTTKITSEALGSSIPEADTIAMLKLIDLFNEIRLELRGYGDLPIPWLALSPDGATTAEKMGRELFRYYREYMNGMSLHPPKAKVWEPLLKILSKYELEDPGLYPLILYYKVC